MTESNHTQQQKQFKILLIGDTCIDTYTYGTVNRISPEAPVPVFEPKYKIVKDGMAGNVAKNLEALGCSVNFFHGEASHKERLIDQRSKQQLMRIDNDVISEPLSFSVGMLSTYDAVVISDYNKGYVSYDLIQLILTACHPKPIFIDTKKTDLDRLQGAWVKINELEYSKIKSECTGLIVTQGSKGAAVIHHQIFCPAPIVEVSDVTGAGDTFLAALAVEYLNTNDIRKAVEFAVKASSVTVQHIGVYAPALKEIK